MKLTLPQLRKLVESTVKDIMKSKKKSLREITLTVGSGCPECGSNDVSDDYDDVDHRLYCNMCGAAWSDDDPKDADFEEEDQYFKTLQKRKEKMYQPDFKVGVGNEPKKLKRW
jgi:hypothetical protein